MNYITDAVKAAIGIEVGPVPANEDVESSEVRRFHHATMDPARRYWDAAFARASRYGGPVAPPAFPVFAWRRGAGEGDPLDDVAKGVSDGFTREFFGLPALDIPLPRLLNGGYEFEFFRYPRVGERIYRTSRYKDIYQRDTSKGPMVFILIEQDFTTGDGSRLMRVTATMILR